MSSYLENEGQKEDINAVIDTLIAGLQRCKLHYNEKAKENIATLERLGFNIDADIPENMKQDLLNLFSDSEVMDFAIGTREHVTVNAQHMQESLVIEDELKEVELLDRAAGIFLKQAEEMHCLLKQKLDSAKDCASHIDEQLIEKDVKEMVFKSQQEKKENHLKMLQEITKNLERPLFSYKEVEVLEAEEKRLQEEVATLEAKLAKYHNLPLDEKAAAQLLAQQKEELKKVDDEIKLKLPN